MVEIEEKKDFDEKSDNKQQFIEKKNMKYKITIYNNTKITKIYEETYKTIIYYIVKINT